MESIAETFVLIIKLIGIVAYSGAMLVIGWRFGVTSERAKREWWP